MNMEQSSMRMQGNMQVQSGARIRSGARMQGGARAQAGAAARSIQPTVRPQPPAHRPSHPSAHGQRSTPPARAAVHRAAPSHLPEPLTQRPGPRTTQPPHNPQAARAMVQARRQRRKRGIALYLLYLACGTILALFSARVEAIALAFVVLMGSALGQVGKMS